MLLCQKENEGVKQIIHIFFSEYSPIDEVVTDNVFINTDNFDGEGGTEAAVEATDNTTSPDSGSFSEHCDQISHQEELNKRLLTTNKRQQANNIRYHSYIT